MELNALFEHFESIGNNCEFGIVQSAASASVPVGLFRNVGFQHARQMIDALEKGLDGMFDAGRYNIVRDEQWGDYALECLCYGFRFHTGIPRDDGNQERMNRQIAVFRFLKNRFLDILRTGEKIFVYRSLHGENRETIQQLFKAVRRHGPGRLLCVNEDPEAKFAWYEKFESDLFVGRIARLSNQNPPLVDFVAWEKICRGVLTLLTPEQPGEAVITPTSGASDMIDLARNKPATQSSRSVWSRASTATEDACRAISGPLPLDYAFHTDNELAPWWAVDLQRMCTIYAVEIVNRPGHDFESRFRYFDIETSVNGFDWKVEFRKRDDFYVSSEAMYPATFAFNSSVKARYLRIVKKDPGVLHLRRIRILGTETANVAKL
jgi:hypothetical protein